MTELSIEDFTRIVVRKLEELNYPIVLENPQMDDDFPCGVVNTILRNDLQTDKGVPIRSSFSVSVHWWANKTYESMAIFDKATKKLRELNFTISGTQSIRYDDLTKKYIHSSNYEVNYNGLTNSFEITK